MADTTPLLASLLMGQRQEENPFQRQRKYGQQLITAGSSTAPLGSGSWAEGLARALQAGIGGLTAGYADSQEHEQNQNNTGIYAQAAAEKDPQKVAALLKGLKGGDPQQTALFGQIIQNNINEGLKQQGAEGRLGSGGYLPQGGTGGNMPSGGGLGITITPNGPNPNNVGNISDGRGGFTQPSSPQQGASDVASLLRSYPVQYNGGQPMTLNQIAMRYNPPDDGRNPQLKGNNPQQWALNVARASGIDPNQPLDFDNPAVLTAVVRGINPAEKAPGDRQPAAVLGAGVQQAMDPSAFPPQAAPGVPGTVARPPMAQGDATPPAPAAPQLQTQSPLGQSLRAQAQTLIANKRFAEAEPLLKQAMEADGKFQEALVQKQNETAVAGAEHDRQFGMTSAEHDRQQSTATPNNEQSLSAGFADRMARSHQIATQFSPALMQFGSRMKDQLPFGIGNYGQSPEYQQAKQARDDFINAQLRRESGAAIAPTEYANADKQYFPQPGDAPEVIKQKEANRALAIQGMVRNAGPTYAQPSAPPTSAPAPAATGGVSEGATATNPQTGQKIIFRGGQWTAAQ